MSFYQESLSNFFCDVPELPPDVVFITKTLYDNDNCPQKVDLGIGAYRDNNGKPVVLEIVRKVEKEIALEGLSKEYLEISGDPTFVKNAEKLLYGDCRPLEEGRIAGVQSLSGTGALRVLSAFTKTALPNATVWVSDPTWANHFSILAHSNLKVAKYRYWNPDTCGLHIHGLLDDLKNAQERDVVLLHACAHNPTGVDPNLEQWEEIANVCAEKKLLPFFDIAYQGFASGDLDKDAAAVRLFVNKGFELLCAQSFAKNFGLYSERIGCASIICDSPNVKKAVQTQLNLIARAMYSNPPSHGSFIVDKILSNNNNKQQWIVEMKEMSSRIMKMRSLLRSKLEELKTPGTWSHITDQIGMFCYTGLSSDQCETLMNNHHIYLLKSGRISMAGVNTNNVDYIAQAFDEVVRKTTKHQ